jgi:hypothetical protein
MSLTATPQTDGQDVLAFVAAAKVLGWKEKARPGTLSKAARPLDYEPKNKPFLVGTATWPAATAEALLAAWAPAPPLVAGMLTGLATCTDPRMQPGHTGGCYGCKTANVKPDFGLVYSAVNDPLGFTAGVIVSLANWKLYALDIIHERWSSEDLVPAVTDLFEFPLRPGEKVPAGNVVHTVYCCAHALAFYLAHARSASPPAGAEYWAAEFRALLTRGLVTLQQIEFGPRRRQFLTEMAAWGGNLLRA